LRHLLPSSPSCDGSAAKPFDTDGYGRVDDLDTDGHGEPFPILLRDLYFSVFSSVRRPLGAELGAEPVPRATDPVLVLTLKLWGAREDWGTYPSKDVVEN
jgi:hypothetical protein